MGKSNSSVGITPYPPTVRPAMGNGVSHSPQYLRPQLTKNPDETAHSF